MAPILEPTSQPTSTTSVPTSDNVTPLRPLPYLFSAQDDLMYVPMACISIVFTSTTTPARTSRPSIFLRDDMAPGPRARLDTTLIGRFLRTPCRAAEPLIGEIERNACCGPRCGVVGGMGKRRADKSHKTPQPRLPALPITRRGGDCFSSHSRAAPRWSLRVRWRRDEQVWDVRTNHHVP